MNGAKARLRRRMLLKAAESKDLVAYALALCARMRGQALADLCELLRCDEHGLFRLALCRRPREYGAAFRLDVNRIASFAGVDPRILANLLREASFLAALPRGTGASSRMLWAAREQDDRFGPPAQPPEQPDPQGPPDKRGEHDDA